MRVRLDVTTYNRDMIYITKKTFYNFEREDAGKYQEKQWKVREVNESTKRQKRSILTFCHSDDSSFVGSNSHRIIDIKNIDTLEKHAGRLWNVFTVDEIYLMYCEFHLCYILSFFPYNL